MYNKRKSVVLFHPFLSRKKVKTAFKVKVEPSFTETETMKNTSLGEGLTSSSLTHSSCYITRGVPVPKSVKGKCCFISTASGRNVDSTTGDGEATIIAAEGSVSQALVVSGTAINYAQNPYRAAVPYRNLMTDSVLSGSSLFPITDIPSTQKTFNMSLGLEVHIANFCTADAVVEMYILESRNHSNRDPKEFLNAQLERYDGGLSGSGQPGAGANTGGAIGRYASQNVVGDPQRVAGFSKEYRTLKKLRFDLSAGSSHEQEFMIRMNLMHDNSIYISKNTAMTDDFTTWTEANVVQMKYPKGMIHVYVHQRGGLVNDVSGGGNSPTYATTKIGYLVKKNLTLHTVAMKETRSAPNIRYHQNPFGAADANLKFVDVVDDIINLGKA